MQQVIAPHTNKISLMIQTVTPGAAELWLRHRAKNRAIKDWNVQRMVTDLKNGNWHLSPDCIALDEDGHLINGQHRCEAIVKSGIPALCGVMYGLPRGKTIRVIDAGTARSPGDHITISTNAANANHTAATVMRVIIWELSEGNLVASREIQKIVTRNDLIERYLADEESFNKAVHFGMNYRQKWYAATMLSMFYFLLLERGSQDVADTFERFMEASRSGANLDEGSPVLALNKAIAVNLAHSKRSDQYKLAILTKAWNAYYRHKPLKNLRWGDEEDFPTIAGLDERG